VVHVRRYFAALAVLLLLCGTYALAVAPWVAPPPLKPRAAAATAPQPAIRPSTNTDLERLFPPDAWERNGAKIIETEQCTLLIRDYQPTPDGKLLLKPCTLIMYTGSQAARRPIVMQAPQGAELVFDRALDLARAQLGRLQRGKLAGDIRIFSPPTMPGGRDAQRSARREPRFHAQRSGVSIRRQFWPRSGAQDKSSAKAGRRGGKCEIFLEWRAVSDARAHRPAPHRICRQRPLGQIASN